MSENAIRCAIEILGEDKILYGSDLPITPCQWGIQRRIGEIQGSRLPDRVKEKILSGNAKALLW